MNIRTDNPKHGPFKVGTKLKHLGKSEVKYGVDGKMVPAKFPGMIVTVVSDDFGHKGTGRYLGCGEDGEEMYDETDDFVSVVENEFKIQVCIHNGDEKEWEILNNK